MSKIWSENDELFKRLLTEGHSWQILPYAFFKLHGFEVDMPDLSIRDSIHKAGKWLQSYDLMIGDKQIEVKSRPFAFTSPADWPENRLPAIVDAKKKWDAKKVKPFAYVFVSRPTGGMVSTCSVEAAHSRWGTQSIWDRTRKIRDEFYVVDRQYLVRMDKLLASLR